MNGNNEQTAETFWKSPFMVGTVGMIAVAVIANVIMVMFSLTDVPGLVTDDYYARGKSYTSRTKVDFLATSSVEATVTGLEQVRVGIPATVTLTGDQTMTGATLFAYRPADATADFSAPLVADGKGSFSGLVPFGLKGKWDLIIEPLGADGAPLPGIARRVVVGE